MTESDKTLHSRTRTQLRSLPESIKRPLRLGFFAIAGGVGSFRNAVGRPWKHLLICGYPRSGTSLLYNMLSTTLPDFYFTPFERRAAPLLNVRGNIASKTPMDVFEVERMIAANPWRKSLLVVVPERDPRDILTSRHPMLPNEYFIGYDHSWWPTPDGGWVYDAPGIGEVARQIDRVMQLGGIAPLRFRYEDLVANPDAVQTLFATRLDLSFVGSFTDFYRKGEELPYRYEGKHAARDASIVRENKPVDSERAGKWKHSEHRQRMIDQFSRFPALFDLLVKMGYEENRDWFAPYASEGAKA